MRQSYCHVNKVDVGLLPVCRSDRIYPFPPHKPLLFMEMFAHSPPPSPLLPPPRPLLRSGGYWVIGEYAKGMDFPHFPLLVTMDCAEHPEDIDPDAIWWLQSCEECGMVGDLTVSVREDEYIVEGTRSVYYSTWL